MHEISIKNMATGIKYDWYQTEDKVIVSIMQKNIKKDDLTLELLNNHISFTLKLDQNTEKQLEIPLSNEIDPKLSTFEILSTKVELKLQKLKIQRWASLEPTTTTDVLPSYPTSSKKVQLLIETGLVNYRNR